MQYFTLFMCIFLHSFRMLSAWNALYCKFGIEALIVQVDLQYVVFTSCDNVTDRAHCDVLPVVPYTVCLCSLL